MKQMLTSITRRRSLDAIPILRPLAESLVGDHVERVMGIINGTTNFILTKMHEHPGFSFADALEGGAGSRLCRG
jgi:homoserine dehydrogenase